MGEGQRMGMVEVDKALVEIANRRGEIARQLRAERANRAPSSIKVRTLEHQDSLLLTKHQTLSGLKREVKELEYSLTLKMMTRYPENRASATEWRRELTRLRRRMEDMAALYQPKEKVKSRWVA